MSKNQPDLSSFDIPRAKKGTAMPVNSKEFDENIERGSDGSASVENTEQKNVQELDLDKKNVGISHVSDAERDEPRTAVTTRLTLSIQERLRQASFSTRKTKQRLIDEALDFYLSSGNF